MAETAIDLQIVEDIFLPYERGAEQWLDEYLWPFWSAILELFPDLTLDPLISGVEVAALSDLTDMARMLDNEPPNVFALFSLVCDDASIETLLPLLQALPFVVWAQPRTTPQLPVVVGFDHNPRMSSATHLRAAVLGHGVMHAWTIPGGTGHGVAFADVEGDYDNAHEELDGTVLPFSYFPDASDAWMRSHGTASLGLVVGRNNTQGLVGIAPDVDARFCSERRADGKVNVADAIFTGAFAALPHGVMLLEMAVAYAPGTGPDVMIETQPAEFQMIQFATSLGVTVIEPAGNAGVNLDTIPVPAVGHTGAVVVGGGYAFQPPNSGDVLWSRQPQPNFASSSFGQRVDCFSLFSGILAPGGPTGGSYYQNANGDGLFGGTSGASAIVAGLACSIQGMALAHGAALRPADIRRLLSDPALGTASAPGQPGTIGVMPDLLRIANDQGWRPVVPFGIARSAGSTVQAFSISDERMAGQTWGMMSPAPVPAQPILGLSTFLATQTPAVAVTTGPNGEWLDLAAISELGKVHHVAWHNQAKLGDFDHDRSGRVVARGHDLAIARTPRNDIVVAGITDSGALIAMTASSRPQQITDFSAPIVIDGVSTFRRTPGPMLIARNTNRVEVVAVDDFGILRWAESSAVRHGQAALTWSASVPGQLPDLAPTAKLGFVAIGDQGIGILGIGADRHLYFWALSAPLSESLDVFPDIEFANEGLVALAVLDNTLVAAAVGSDNRVWAMFRQLDDTTDWYGRQAVDSDVEVSPLGGVQVVIEAHSISLHAILPDGRPCRADYLSNIGWGRFQLVE